MRRVEVFHLTMIIVNLPLSIPISKNKKFILNLNNYRNAHYQTLAKAKSNYTDLVVKLLKGYSEITDYPLTLEYTYYAKTARRIDIANPLSVIDKFTQDAIVKAGILIDDNSKIINRVIFNNGGTDKDNSRAELVVYKT